MPPPPRTPLLGTLPPRTPKALSKGIRGLKGSVCRPFCCFNNRISCQTESSDLLAQKSLLRNSFRCQGRLRDYSETRSAASLTLGDDGQGPRAVPPGPVFGTSAGGIAVSRLPAHRLVLVVTLELGFPIDRLGCLVISSCSLHQSVAISRTKALHCPLSSPGKPSPSSYTRGGRGAAHRGNVTCLYLRAAPSEIDA